MVIEIPAAAGEVLDKLSILRIKLARIEDPAKQANVARELAALTTVWARALPDPAPVADLADALLAVNQRLWDIEDALRAHEAVARFDAEFVALARSVYRLNDQRAALKRDVNLRLGSVLIEEKSYAAY